jgi:group I intron endonuclease
MGYIYMLRNKINDKIYIGQTYRPIQKRLEEHKVGKNIGCVAIYRAIQKYGWDNFEKDWYECPYEDLNFDEELLVREMGTLSPDGYNLREGGGSHGKMSVESKQKMSVSTRGENNPMYGKRHSDETKQKNREKHLGKTLSEETKKKLSEANIGRIHTDESKQKMSEARRGKNYCSIKVYQYNLDGTFIDSFDSCRDAARQLKKGHSAIGRCANGTYKTAYGFKWSYNKSDE